MIVQNKSVCPNCQYILEKESKFCPDCATPLEWDAQEPMIIDTVRYGTIVCECGQEFYFETKRPVVHCIKCNKEYSTATYPVKEVAQYGIDVRTSDDSQ